MVTENDGFLMLLDAAYFNGVKLGYISEDGIEWGGDDAEYIRLNAAQKRDSPVKKIRRRAATNVLIFRLIELLPENCQTVMGGEIDGTKWDYPEETVTKEGSFKILTGTGQTILMHRTSMDGKIRGNLGGDQALGIDTEIEMLQPLDGTSPMSIDVTTPFITAKPAELSFAAAGENKVINVEASGPFSVSKAPEGFSVEIRDGRITVIAAENTGSSSRTGKLTFTLKDDSTKTAEVTLTQAAS